MDWILTLIGGGLELPQQIVINPPQPEKNGLGPEWIIAISAFITAVGGLLITKNRKK